MTTLSTPARQNITEQISSSVPGRLSGSDLVAEWDFVRWHFARCIRRNGHVVLSTVLSSGEPNAAAIGSMVLNRDRTGYYLEKFTRSVRRSGGVGAPVSVLAVDPGKGFWLRSLIRGQFRRPAAVRLRGTAGALRPGTNEERERFLRLVKSLKWTKGHGILWADMAMVREIRFDSVEYVCLGRMSPTRMGTLQ